MPLAIDLYCGLGGWASGFLSEGYDVIGFDIERHDYGTGGYPGQLVLQDVTTLHGSQFRDADIIVASPPCQAYSYRAMPWKRAKALPPPDNTLFDTCFRIQKQANYAAGHECLNCAGGGRQGHFRPCAYCKGEGWIYGHIPLIVENVKGAQKWVGRASSHFGSFYLWGDVPALMPITFKTTSGHRQNPDGLKVPGMSWSGYGQPGYTPKGFNVTAAQRYRELEQFAKDRYPELVDGQKFPEGIKQHGSGPEWFDNGIAKHSSRSDSRKAASAQIAKIPLPLARHIACVFKPQNAKIEA